MDQHGPEVHEHMPTSSLPTLSTTSTSARTALTLATPRPDMYRKVVLSLIGAHHQILLRFWGLPHGVHNERTRPIPFTRSSNSLRNSEGGTTSSDRVRGRASGGSAALRGQGQG